MFPTCALFNCDKVGYVIKVDRLAILFFCETCVINYNYVKESDLFLYSMLTQYTVLQKRLQSIQSTCRREFSV
jgi:hypothetical protein